jgi:ketosteroid isomerase-like protein
VKAIHLTHQSIRASTKPQRLVRTLIRSTIAGTLMAFAASAGADDSTLKATLEARYGEMEVAMEARDEDAVSALLAPDFVSEDVNGNRAGKDEMLRDLAALPKDPNKSSGTTLVSVERRKETAAVIQRYRMTTRKTKPDGSVQDVELVAVSRDVWLISGGRWLIQSTVTEQMDYKINGALVIHKQHKVAAQ